MATQLADFADRHACDKGRRGPSSKWEGTNYTDIYQAYFHQRRNERLNLLEIGLGVKGPNWRAEVVHGRNLTGGASIKMWKDYFPNATITGADINPATFLDDERVTTYQVDQGSRDSWKAFLDTHPDPSFDYIIDDGSHIAEHQQVTLEMLWPHLKPGGVFFIEDLNDYGAGERDGGRFSSCVARGTRAILKYYLGTGEILEPNAFESTDFLKEADILFYNPRPLQRPRDMLFETMRLVNGSYIRGMIRTEWAEGTERMAALARAPSPPPLSHR